MDDLKVFCALNNMDIGQMYVAILEGKLQVLYKALPFMDGVDLARAQGKCILLSELITDIKESRDNLEHREATLSSGIAGQCLF
jgi:hypothetical protein